MSQADVKQQTDSSNTSSDPLIRAETYGSDYYGHLLEEYKLYVEMADRVSARRIQASQFYISLLATLFGVISFLVDKKIFPESEGLFLLLGSLLGICLCFVWHININSYSQLNSLKFKVIEEIEKNLPFPCYTREWQIDKKSMKYQRLSKVEKYVPATIALLYLILIIYTYLDTIK